MTMFYLPPEHRSKFLNVIKLAPTLIYSPLHTSNFIHIHDATIIDVPTVHIKPARPQFGQSYKLINTSIMSQLHIIPPEAVYVFLRDLVGLPNE